MNKCNIMIINSINETSRETWRTLVTTSSKSYSLIGKEASNENNLSQRSITPPSQYWQTILQYNASNHKRNTSKPNITALCSAFHESQHGIPHVQFYAYMQLVLWTLFFFVWLGPNEVKATYTRQPPWPGNETPETTANQDPSRSSIHPRRGPAVHHQPTRLYSSETNSQ